MEYGLIAFLLKFFQSQEREHGLSYQFVLMRDERGKENM